MTDTTQGIAPRGSLTRWLWSGLWFGLLLLATTLLIDGFRRAVPLPVWGLWFLPLLVILPGLLRDRLRSVVWLCFVTLLYFVAAVQRLFAEPGSERALAELCAVILLFVCAMFYIRQRARELRPPGANNGEG